MQRSVSGKLLVAVPALADPHFARSVVYILEHNNSGAVGLVLNHPGDGEFPVPLNEIAGALAAPGVPFVGGPVLPEGALCLASGPVALEFDSFEADSPGIGRLDIDAVFHLVRHALPGSMPAMRIFFGHAGWGPGQLDGELLIGSWIVVDCDPGDPFVSDPAQLYAKVLLRQGNADSALAFVPDDLLAN